MTLLGNFVEMSRQEGNEPSIMEQKERKKYERPKPASSSRRKWLSNCFSCRSYSSKRCFFLLVLLSVQNFPTESFIHLLKAEGALADSWELRPVKYLNHLVEQDHRFLKRLVKPGLGFFSPETAWNTLEGDEMMHMLRKGQMYGGEQGDVMGQVAFISGLFGVAA